MSDLASDTDLQSSFPLIIMTDTFSIHFSSSLRKNIIEITVIQKVFFQPSVALNQQC